MKNRGKRVTLKSALIPYAKQIQQQFALNDVSAAVNLIVGWTSQNCNLILPVHPHPVPAAPQQSVSKEPEATADNVVAINPLDELEDMLAG